MSDNFIDIDGIEEDIYNDVFYDLVQSYANELKLEEEEAIKNFPYTEGINNDVTSVSRKQYTADTLARSIFSKSYTYTPVDTGRLISSLSIRKYKDGYVVGYFMDGLLNKGERDYSVYVHEIPYSHLNGGRYKFLEDAAIECYSEFFNNYNVQIPLTITYQPLMVYVGVSDAPGYDLMSVKMNQSRLLTKENYEHVKESLNTKYYRDSKNQGEYYNKLMNYFYLKNNNSDKSVGNVKLLKFDEVE